MNRHHPFISTISYFFQLWTQKLEFERTHWQMLILQEVKLDHMQCQYVQTVSKYFASILSAFELAFTPIFQP